MKKAIRLEKVRKTYGSSVAIDEISFTVNKGEISCHDSKFIITIDGK